MQKPTINLFSWKRLFRFILQGQIKKVLFSIFVLSILGFTFVPILFLLRGILDMGIPQANINLVILNGAIILSITLFSNLLSNFLKLHLHKITTAGLQKYFNALYSSILTLSFNELQDLDLKTLQARIPLENQRFQEQLSLFSTRLIPSIVGAFGIFLVMLLISWQLFLIVSVFLPIAIGVNRIQAFTLENRIDIFRKSLERYAKYLAIAFDALELIFLKNTYQLEKKNHNHYQSILKSSSDEKKRSHLQINFTQNLLSRLLFTVVLIVGAILIINGKLTIGNLVGFIFLTNILSTKLNNTASDTIQLLEINNSLNNLEPLFIQRPHVNSNTITASLKEGVKAVNLSFSYDENQVFSSLDFEIPPSKVTLIYGPNGSGKSTLMRLLMGYYNPSSGNLYYGSTPHEQVSFEQLRPKIGVVSQHPIFFPDSIYNNLTYGLGKISKNAIKAVCRRVQAHEFIENLPGGYDFHLGENEVQLSGGERQRLAIARALLGNPEFLILDEPINHLDTETVKNLVNALRSLPNKPTIIIISHDKVFASIADHAIHFQKKD
ncbi:MAG: ABC transporter ATP-binding protein/permease [Schleiferiaceae bacterium]|nr:ABC transporter ATP-binding protein/permease [Schleiferiaceae bacterium]